jgi:hypothetical protein
VFDGLAGKQNALGFTPEDVANKQTDLTASATKYPTVNAVNTGLATKQSNLKIVNPKDFGAVGDNITDDTTAFQLAIDSIATTGGQIFIPSGTYLIAGQLVLPDSLAVSNPQMPSISIIGAGSNHNGRGLAPKGGTILNMTYSGTYGKLIGIGLGYCKIENLTFTDSGSSSTPFIYGNYPSWHIVGNTFYGNKTGLLADQDAIVLGGTLDIEGPRGADNGFQGYGTVIERNYFNRIRRGVYGRVYFNANVIQNNTWWSSCGSADNTIGAIDIDGDPASTTAQVATGNVITGNLIEMTNYGVGIRLSDAEKNTLIANNFYDGIGGKIQTNYLFTSTAKYNYVVAGFYQDAYPLINTAALLDNTVIDVHSGKSSNFTEKNIFKGATDFIPSTDAISPITPRLINSSNKKMFNRFPSGDRVQLIIASATDVETLLNEIRDFGSGVITHTMKGTDSRLESEGTLRVRSKGAGSELWLGSTTTQNIYIIDGVLYSNKANGTAPLGITSKTPVNNLTVTRIDNGTLIATDSSSTTGATIRTGTGSPEGVVTALIGSIYTRTDGGAGTTLYVKESGTGNTGWIAK